MRGPLGWRWANGDSLRAQVAVNGIREHALVGPEPNHTHAVQLLERWPQAWRVLAVGSLLLEIGAPIALLDRRLGRLWSVAAWSMHVGIKQIMSITFRYQLAGVAYAPFSDTDRLLSPTILRTARH